MRIALALEYDGAAFLGWQSQPHGRTVQDHLEAALSEIACEPIRVSCAGRTDAGVHALVQVVHFDVSAVRPLSAWVRGTNARLPRTIAVRWAVEVAPEFNARFQAVARHYRYVLFNSPVRPALFASRVGWYHVPLDVELMAQGATHLIGAHDFSSFRAAGCQAKSPIKTLHSVTVERVGQHIVFGVHGSAFLHHMVRNIVGALVFIGKGAHPPEWMATVLAARDRTNAAPTFEASGLYLSGVEYDARWQLPHNGLIIAPFPSLPL